MPYAADGKRIYDRRRYLSRRDPDVVYRAWQKALKWWDCDEKGRRNVTVATYRARQAHKLATRDKPDCCEVCGGTGMRRIVLDHNHQTGEFRGWLCDDCNLVLGHLHDDPERLRKLAAYLEGGK